MGERGEHCWDRLLVHYIKASPSSPGSQKGRCAFGLEDGRRRSYWCYALCYAFTCRLGRHSCLVMTVLVSMFMMSQLLNPQTTQNSIL